ncbi:MAG: NAD(P)/FAD-dependent oxidoreductase [Bacteroidetes bacterium]|nr:NAD(P)/FAD-dependent oxidoreductase [Bacteroidota bacterium]
MWCSIPESTKKRIVIVGAGFAGLKLASKLNGSDYQVILLDQNNYHQFQPLFYQVATAGLEPSAISFPLRKVFQKSENTIIRIASVSSVDTEKQVILTSLGMIRYDFLVLATGTTTNFFGMEHIRALAIPMKSVAEALRLRNQILQNFEDALTTGDKDQLERLMNIVVVGGGPTGVEISGTLAEMRKYILPKDYPELDFSQMKIHLVEAGDKLLAGMKPSSSAKALKYLDKLGVDVILKGQVSDYDGNIVSIKDVNNINAGTLVWAAGVSAEKIPGLPENVFTRGNRILVNRYNQVEGFSNLFALGDIASMTEGIYRQGHPQLAQPAIQQAKLLAGNFMRIRDNKPLKSFLYHDKGSMATVGRNLAVVDLPFISFYGFFAWLTWMFVHLMAIVGVKNRLLVFINWFWNYITYDQSLRLIIKPLQRIQK